MWGEGVEDRIAPKGAIRNCAGRSFKVVDSITHNLVTRDTILKKCHVLDTARGLDVPVGYIDEETLVTHEMLVKHSVLGCD